MPTITIDFAYALGQRVWYAQQCWTIAYYECRQGACGISLRYGLIPGNDPTVAWCWVTERALRPVEEGACVASGPLGDHP